ncbi:ATP-dependent DNA helicase [Thermophagus xiamenensis]|uniref:UvrD-like helicase C-terminal domain-containing protein n=1 Tax=Thermophagus xiamenensis TaxID=385682 RepID=A0A1I2F9M0_9BACT|nr:ATP-dependent RecD-like DNA helicase [Thermophagus xiamenensis]SFF01230.1 UvrD-like helicase C-terminal domain-containing protein [Thermophagus xiamenensis]
MNKIDNQILTINKVICKNIDKFDACDRGILSQIILSQLRNFVEHISLKIYDKGKNLDNSYENIKKAIKYVKSIGKLKFLSNFHKLLQISTSHYTLDEENSERLMLKYHEYLIKVKSYLKEVYNLDVLENIDKFPLKIDSTLFEYYEKIAEKLNQSNTGRKISSYNDRYYIQKIKPFVVNYKVYYEVTLTRANDYVSKFDRIIAFTKLDISSNYAVKLRTSYDSINILDKNMPIQIIDNWEVSIRPCEIDHFADFFGKHPKIGGTKEIYQLMKYLTETGFNLVDLIDFTDNQFNHIKEKITNNANATPFLNILEKCRSLTKGKHDGHIVIRYLLYKLNNKILKKQFNKNPCPKLSNLYLDYGCIPFDQIPFNSSLKNHNPKLLDLYRCIDTTNREHELLARLIKINTEQKGQLYTPKSNITNFENIEKLIDEYNDNIYHKHNHRKIDIFKNNIFIRGYEDDTYQIIEKLKKMSSEGIKNYSNSVMSWLQTSSYKIDCNEKKKALIQMFEKSRVALIYGAAGTGKSTMINHISNFFNENKKLYLANTNPAVDNLKRKVSTANCTFKTITKFLSNSNNETNYDLLIIDECSTTSNSNMLKVLEKASFKLLVLVGDVFQIESILFGNWFILAKAFVSSTAIFELKTPYRSNNKNLLALWENVRNLNNNILECLARNNYSITIDESIFDQTENDEIILCLNYDGLYGINNINRFLQATNKNTPIEWGTHIYKINDPILFNETDRFTPLIYNNLKGRITNIKVYSNKIQFDIEVDKVINEFEAENYDFELLDNAKNGNSIIRFCVNKNKSTDEDDDISSNSIVPFQVAYAISIHKAQGLEYRSVKIVITNEVEEMISHNIFYTAITRAREKLKIYWTPETEAKILKNFKKKSIKLDASILNSKYEL